MVPHRLRRLGQSMEAEACQYFCQQPCDGGKQAGGELRTAADNNPDAARMELELCLS